MELDKRILPGKYILTCFDAKEAEQFVGQMGYAADDISMFSDLDYISFCRRLGCKAQRNKNSLHTIV